MEALIIATVIILGVISFIFIKIKHDAKKRPLQSDLLSIFSIIYFLCAYFEFPKDHDIDTFIRWSELDFAGFKTLLFIIFFIIIFIGFPVAIFSSPLIFIWFIPRIIKLIYNTYFHLRVLSSEEKYKYYQHNKVTKYDVVLSFSGEDRKIVDKVAKCLTKNGLYIFYDDNEKTNLFGKNLYDTLIDVYRDKAKFCVVFISQTYNKRAWTLHELRSAQSRALFEDYEYILPIKLDSSSIPSILDTIGYLDISKDSIYDICAIITHKVNLRRDFINNKLT